jgi:hypothetical protein
MNPLGRQRSDARFFFRQCAENVRIVSVHGNLPIRDTPRSCSPRGASF